LTLEMLDSTRGLYHTLTRVQYPKKTDRWELVMPETPPCPSRPTVGPQHATAPLATRWNCVLLLLSACLMLNSGCSSLR